jgi:hypothetical protein
MQYSVVKIKTVDGWNRGDTLMRYNKDVIRKVTE